MIPGRAVPGRAVPGRAGPAALALVAALVLCLPAAALGHGIGGIIRDVPTGAHSRPWALRMTTLQYQGGPVLHSNRTHLIFWEPSGSGLAFEPGYETLMGRFLGQVAADSRRTTNVYGLTGQYSDSRGPAVYDSTYAGATVATDPLPASGCVEPPITGPGWLVCMDDAQVQQEVEHVVSAHRLPRGATDIYFLVLPKGLGNCSDATSTSCALGGSSTGYCGYHSQTQDGLLYAVIPYNAVPGHCQSENPRPNGNTADPTISTLSHEHNETITDPSTYDSWIDPSGNEDGDLCITNFGPAIGGAGAGAWNESIAGGHYFLQEEWSNEDGGCAPRDEADRVSFAAPARVAAGKAASFTARASDPDGRIVAISWFFGDGGSSRRSRASHAFARAGSYRVVLRVTDSAANWTSFARTIHVAPAPAREPRRRAATRPLTPRR